MGWQSRDKSSGKLDVFPDGKADWRQVVREKGRFSGWDGSPETSCPGKGLVSRMGKLAGDMSSGKLDVFPDGKAGWRHVVREIGRFPGWESWLGTSCPGKGPVFRMGWQSRDKSSGKLDVFPDEISLVIVILPQVCPSRGGKPDMKNGCL